MTLNIKHLLFGLLLIILFVTYFLFAKYQFKKAIKTAVRDFIKPYLMQHGYEFCSFDLLPNQFLGIFKERGNWQFVMTNIFHDTKYNRKVYGNLIYKTIDGIEICTTVKITHDFIGNPIKVLFKPEII